MAFVAAVVAALHVAFAAPGGHAPRVGTNWHYTVRATIAGRPARGRLTVQVVDPLGGVHGVQFGKTSRYVTRFPFRGVFRDFITWPKESRGIPVKLRITVFVGKARKVVQYAVTPRG